MEGTVSDMVGALARLQLEDLDATEYDAVLNAEASDGGAFVPSYDESAIELAIEAYTDATAALDVWLSAGGSHTPDEQTSFWEAFSTTAPLASKLLCMRIQHSILGYLVTNPKPEVSPASVDALAAVKFYLTLLRVPGVKAYGILETGLVRRCLLVCKRVIEIVTLSHPPEASSKRFKSTAGIVSRGAAPASQPSSDAGRRNVRRGGAGRSAPVDTDEAMDDGEHEEGDKAVAVEDSDSSSDADGDEEMTTRKRPTRRTTAKAAAPTPASSPLFRVPADQLGMLRGTLLAITLWARDFSLKTHPELLPLLVDTTLGYLYCPAHICDGRTGGSLEGLSESDDLVTLAAATVLFAVRPTHGAPLTTTRLVCKKLKGLLLLGRATASSIALSFGVLGEEEDELFGGESTAPALGLSKPIDAKTVRTRAVHIITSLVRNSLSTGAAAAHTPQPIPAAVLAGLPAVEALLQHMCVAAASSKAEVRAHVTSVICELRGILPHSLRRAFVRFLNRFSRSGKVQYRLFGVELAARLLDDAPTSHTPSGALQVYSEQAVPSPEEQSEEMLGYGLEAAAYAGTGSEDEFEAADEGTAGAMTPGLATTPFVKRKSSKGRPSICMMGADMSSTPARFLLGVGTPGGDGGASGAGASTSVFSPFYGSTKKAVRVKGRRDSSCTAASFFEETKAPLGCVDARPTALILLDQLLHRCSDKSPVVRARSLVLMSQLLDGSKHPHARQNALLLAYLSSLSATLKNQQVPGSEITMADVSAGGVGVTLLNGSHAGLDATTATSGGSVGGVQSRALVRISMLVPVLVRRMEEESRPHIKKAAIGALAALATSGGCGAITCKSLLQHYTSKAAGSDEEAEGTLTYEELVTLNDDVRSAAAALEADGVAVSPSRVIGLFALQMLAAKAADKSVLVRKAAICALDSILEAEPGSVAVQQLWLAAVVPLVLDVEPTIAAKAVELVSVRTFTGVCERTPVSPAAQATKGCAWALLHGIAVNEDLRTCLEKVVEILARSASAGGPLEFPLGPLLSALQQRASSIEGYVGVSPEQLQLTSWTTLNMLVQQYFGRNTSAAAPTRLGKTTVEATLLAMLPFFKKSWYDLASEMKKASSLASSSGSAASPANTTTITLNDSISSIALHFPSSGDAPSSAAQEAAEVVSACATNCLLGFSLLIRASSSPDKTLAEFIGDVVAGLAAFSWSPALISAALKACTSATLAMCHTQDAVQKGTDRWASTVLAAAESGLLHVFRFRTSEEVSKYSSPISTVLYTIGELALLGVDSNSGQGVTDHVAASTTTSTASGGALRATTVSLPLQLVTIAQALLAPSVVTHASEGEEASVDLPESVRAHAYLTLGKLCLRDGALAKKYVSVFVRDLSSKASPVSVRNNILFVLGDLCVRYTALVDRYVPQLACCIADPSPMIRRHAICLLTQLVVEEYIKLRGPLFYRLATAVADSDELVRRSAEAALSGALVSKNKNALSTHFTGLVFVLSGCTTHPAYRHMAGSGAGVEDVGSLEAEVAAASDYAIPSTMRRTFIYKTLLGAMPEEQRLGLYGKLAADVLASASEGMLPLSNATSALASDGSSETGAFAMGSSELLISDVLAVMSSAEMRSATNHRGGSGSEKVEVDEDDGMLNGVFDEAAGGGGGIGATSGAAALAAARSRLLTKVVRKQVVENVLPICLGLRQILLHEKSALMGPLLGFFKVLFEDHAQDVKDTLASDRQTAAELEYDMRMWSEKPAASASAATPRGKIVRTRSAPAAGSALTTPLAPSAAATSTPARGIAAGGKMVRTASEPLATGTFRSPTGAIMTSPRLKASVPRTPSTAGVGAAATAGTIKTSTAATGRSSVQSTSVSGGAVLLSVEPMTAAAATSTSAAAWNVSVPPSPFKGVPLVEDEAEVEDIENDVSGLHLAVAKSGPRAASRSATTKSKKTSALRPTKMN